MRNIKNNTQKVTTTYKSDAKTCTIQSDGNKMFHILSNLYKYPLEAVVRELSTNCKDSHISANQTKPFKIILSESEIDDDNTLIFEDYGVGMSNDDIMNVYSEYGNSTKTEDSTQTGWLGLGSKSPLAVANSFSITSTHNGVQTSYVVYKNEENIPSIQTIHVEENDSYTSGMRITININKKEYNHSRIKSAIYSQLAWFDNKPLVIINGKVSNIWDYSRDDLEINKGRIKYSKDCTSIVIKANIDENYNDTSEHLIIGDRSWMSGNTIVQNNIGYKLDNNIIDAKSIVDDIVDAVLFSIDELGEIDDDAVAELIKEGIKYDRLAIFVKNDTVSFTPSREELIYDTQTINTIHHHLISFFTQGLINTYNYIKNSKDEWTICSDINDKTAYIDVAHLKCLVGVKTKNGKRVSINNRRYVTLSRTHIHHLFAFGKLGQYGDINFITRKNNGDITERKNTHLRFNKIYFHHESEIILVPYKRGILKNIKNTLITLNKPCVYIVCYIDPINNTQEEIIQNMRDDIYSTIGKDIIVHDPEKYINKKKEKKKEKEKDIQAHIIHSRYSRREYQMEYYIQKENIKKLIEDKSEIKGLISINKENMEFLGFDVRSRTTIKIQDISDVLYDYLDKYLDTQFILFNKTFIDAADEEDIKELYDIQSIKNIDDMIYKFRDHIQQIFSEFGRIRYRNKTLNMIIIQNIIKTLNEEDEFHCPHISKIIEENEVLQHIPTKWVKKIYNNMNLEPVLDIELDLSKIIELNRELHIYERTFEIFSNKHISPNFTDGDLFREIGGYFVPNYINLSTGLLESINRYCNDISSLYEKIIEKEISIENERLEQWM
jgi:hypothetical protein